MKNNEIPFFGRQLTDNGHVDKIYTKDRERCIFLVQKYTVKVSKIYHMNDLSSFFPYYDFGDNYRENEQINSIQSSFNSFNSICRSFSCCVIVFLIWHLMPQSFSLYKNYYVPVTNLVNQKFCLKVQTRLDLSTYQIFRMSILIFSR